MPKPAPKVEPPKKDYVVKVDGWLDGSYRTKGEKVPMSERAARYHLLDGKVDDPDVLAAQAAAEAKARAKEEAKAASMPQAAPAKPDAGKAPAGLGR